MGTRSRIGTELSDGSVLSVYCHWDGYPEFNGKVLRQYYNTTEKVSNLINGGNISALHTNSGWSNETLPEVGPLYYTSRGETLEQNEPEMSSDFGEYLKMSDQCGEEYSYIFSNGEWSCYNVKSYDDAYMERVTIPAGNLKESN